MIKACCESSIEVLAVGTSVTLVGDVDAKIAGVSIRQDAITYECVWWVGDERRSAWFQPFEIESSGCVEDKILVGFRVTD